MPGLPLLREACLLLSIQLKKHHGLVQRAFGVDYLVSFFARIIFEKFSYKPFCGQEGKSNDGED